MARITRNMILKEIGNPNLSLHEGDGYWYFVYDDGQTYEDRSVMTFRLNNYSLAEWVGIGQEFVQSVEDDTFEREFRFGSLKWRERASEQAEEIAKHVATLNHYMEVATDMGVDTENAPMIVEMTLTVAQVLTEKAGRLLDLCEDNLDEERHRSIIKKLIAVGTAANEAH